jgi:hypothetical protein
MNEQEAAERRVMTAIGMLDSLQNAGGTNPGPATTRWIHAAENDLLAARTHLADIEAGFR